MTVAESPEVASKVAASEVEDGGSKRLTNGHVHLGDRKENESKMTSSPKSLKRRRHSTPTSTWPLRRTSSANPAQNAGDLDSTSPPLTTVLLRLSAGSFPLEVVQATLVESAAGSEAAGVYYERPVDEMVVLDEAKKLLYCVRRQTNDVKENDVMLSSVVPVLREEAGSNMSYCRKSLAAAAAASRWRRKCRQRRLQRRLMMARPNETPTKLETKGDVTRVSQENEL